MGLGFRDDRKGVFHRNHDCLHGALRLVQPLQDMLADHLHSGFRLRIVTEQIHTEQIVHETLDQVMFFFLLRGDAFLQASKRFTEGIIEELRGEVNAGGELFAAEVPRRFSPGHGGARRWKILYNEDESVQVCVEGKKG